jgi:hypothetical protein
MSTCEMAASDLDEFFAKYAEFYDSEYYAEYTRVFVNAVRVCGSSVVAEKIAIAICKMHHMQFHRVALEYASYQPDDQGQMSADQGQMSADEIPAAQKCLTCHRWLLAGEDVTGFRHTSCMRHTSRVAVHASTASASASSTSSSSSESLSSTSSM